MISVYPRTFGFASQGSFLSFFRNATHSFTKAGLLLLLAAGVQNASAQGGGCPTPSFQLYGTYPTESSSEGAALATGDLNGDGIDDVVGSSTSSLFVLLNKGDGTLAAPVQYATGDGSPQAVAIADFNGDHKADIVVGTGVYTDEPIVVFFNNGDGTFTKSSPIPARSFTVNAIAAADLNGDGAADIAYTPYAFDGPVVVLLNNGSGVFNDGGHTYGGPAEGGGAPSLAIADFNGDKHPDLAIAGNYQYPVGVLLNQGDGTFSRAVYLENSDPNDRYITSGDFNGDGKIDRATANPISGNTSVFLGLGNGSFGAPTLFATGVTYPRSILTSDVNGDGKLDLAVGSAGSGNISVLLGKGDGSFGAATLFASGGTYAYCVASGKLNSDTKPDLAVLNATTGGLGTVSVLLNTCVTVADSDGDGVPDAYDCEPYNKKVAKYLVCHKGKTLCIGKDGVQDHLGHGDKLGTCGSTTPVTMNAATPYRVPEETVAASSVYPNPTKGAFTLQLNNAAAGPVQAQVLDVRGAVVERRNLQLRGGTQTIGFNLQGKAAGLYLLKVVSAAGEQQFKVYVQR